MRLAGECKRFYKQINKKTPSKTVNLLTLINSAVPPNGINRGKAASVVSSLRVKEMDQSKGCSWREWRRHWCRTALNGSQKKIIWSMWTIFLIGIFQKSIQTTPESSI